MSYTRTNIYLTVKQKAELEALAARDDLKTAELIRRILDEYIKEARRAS